MPSAFVRGDSPTYTFRPATTTSPPSIVAGRLMRSISRNCRKRGLDSSRFGASRLGAGRHHDRELVEDDRRVLDKHAIRHRAVDVEHDDLGAALLQRVRDSRVLPKRELVVDVHLIDERPLAPLHVRRRYVCESDQRSRIGSCHGRAICAVCYGGPRNCSRRSSRSIGAPTNRFSGKVRNLSISS